MLISAQYVSHKELYMLIKILPGEYLWSESGLHVIDSSGFATIATEESEVEVADEAQVAIIQAYQEEKRRAVELPPAAVEAPAAVEEPAAQSVEEPVAVEEPIEEPENTNG
jgi:hypothetical protein